ncbi:MAG: AAA family ATPase [Candidatus Aenigmarchaeota archaeon]|nr:AAA family ATPase [Candidatus Aenigmarchaeota archaeon]
MIEAYEKSTDQWLQKQGWKENPFTLKILPSAFVGYQDQVKRLTRHIREGHKFALVIGATGSGKTTLLSLFKDELAKDHDVIYAPKPPKPEELVMLVTERYPQSIIHRLIGKRVNIHGLAGYVNNKAKRNLVVLIDEGHEADTEALEWLRSVTDQCDRMQLVLAGLPTLDELLRRNLETLRSRVTTRVELVALNESDVNELVRRRIEGQGGSGIKPFTEEVVQGIYKRSGGFPREVLKLCDALVQTAMENETNKISSLGSAGGPAPNVSVQREQQAPAKDFMRDLPYKQRKIVTAMSQEDNMYPSEIAERMGLDKYKSKQHAVRSVNNILQRLAADGLVERVPRGKGYVYSLVPSIKNALIQG